MTQPQPYLSPRENPLRPYVGGDVQPADTPPGTTPDPPPDTPVYDESAYTFLTAMLQQWDLASLAPTVLQLLQDGYTTEAIPILLQDTSAYKQRFAGNEERRKAGLPVLAPGEYLAAERSYRNVMQAAGLPAGFYDDYSDFAGFIGRDVSPVEVQRRVDSALIASNNVDQTWVDQFQEYYGIGREHLASYFLDPERGMDVLNKALRGTTIGTAARERGINVDKGMAEQFGIAADENNYGRQAGQFAEFARTGGKLGQIYGTDYTTQMAGEQVFSGNLTYADVLKKLASREEGEFNAGSGVGEAALKTRAQY